jgi:hypothetical protein
MLFWYLGWRAKMGKGSKGEKSIGFKPERESLGVEGGFMGITVGFQFIFTIPLVV